MRRFALLVLLALAACGRSEPEPPQAAAVVSFRDRGVPIGSTTRSTAGLAGDWVIAQSFPGTPFAAPGTRLAVVPATGDEGVLRFEGPGGATELRVAGVASGRFEVDGGSPDLWLLWVDDDARTAVIGTPDGSLGWIMNRPGEGSPDRTTAAREVLDFNGYDVARLGS